MDGQMHGWMDGWCLLCYLMIQSLWSKRYSVIYITGKLTFGNHSRERFSQEKTI